jgi:hypothetical protein
MIYYKIPESERSQTPNPNHSVKPATPAPQSPPPKFTPPPTKRK